MQQYNTNNSAVKRIMHEMREMAEEPHYQYSAAPLEDNIFEWHFTIRGPKDTEFEGGCYHGRIILPPEYPFKPPSILLLTPSGRFDVNKKICLSNTSYHPERWQPSWSIRTVLVALIGFMPTKGDGAIGSLDFPIEERKRLAKLSHDFVCDKCSSDLLQLIDEPTTPQQDKTNTTTSSTLASDTENTSQTTNNEIVEKKFSQHRN